MNGAKHRFALGLTCFFLIGITVVYPFLLYTPNAFVTRWREWYIETAMGTMTHQWLATWFIPENIINEVMTKRYLMNQKQEGIVSNWDGAWEEKEKDTAETPKDKFYAMFSELDESEFERFLADKPEWRQLGLTRARLRFTTESPEKCVRVLRAYQDRSDYRPQELTRGLFYRGVE